MTAVRPENPPVRQGAFDTERFARIRATGVRRSVAFASLSVLLLAGCSTEPRPEDPYPTHYEYEVEEAEPLAEAQSAPEKSTPEQTAATTADSKPAASASTRTAAAPATAAAATTAAASTQAPAATGSGGDPERYLPRATKRDDNLSAILAQPTRRHGEATGTATAAEPPTPVAPLPAAAADTLRVHLLNVGTGSCQIVECPGSDDVLVVDCGSMDGGASDLNRAAIAGYLESIGAGGSVKVVLTHPHENHYNRIPALMGARQATSIWLGGVFDGYGGATPDRIDDWLDAQAKAGVPIYVGFPPAYGNRGVPVAGLSCGTAETFILTTNVGDDPNTNSLMLLVQHGSFRIVFPGDAQAATEDSALTNFGALLAGASVVVAANHGDSDAGGNGADWARHVAPQAVVFSAGGAHGQPGRAVGDRYLESVFEDVALHPMWWDPSADGTTQPFETARAVYSTALSGRVIIDSDGQAFAMTCEKDSRLSDCL
jgi:beta-lactamase superfamily II metal-dependent hydrolase